MRAAFVILTVGWAIGCASGGDDGATPSDAGIDTTVEPDAVANDVVTPPLRDASTAEAARDTGMPDAEPADAAHDAGEDAPLEAGDGGCLSAGQPCSTNAQDCPILFVCNSAFDGGLDGGPNDGICLFAFDVPVPCNDGMDHCPTGQSCLLASQICLTGPETQCVCNNPIDMPACGPP